MTDLIYRTDPPPWAHQLRGLEMSWEKVGFMLAMEQRTGKTRIVIDTVINLFANDLINGFLIVAPNGPHLNWMNDELPRFVPPEFEPRLRNHLWITARSRTVAARESLARIQSPEPDRLDVLAMNVESLRTDRAFDVAVRFVQRHRCLLAIDESQTVATPGAKQTKRARALARRAAYRRTLTGTPATESPFQLYSQYACLDPEILGFTTFAAFKQRYGEFSEGYNHAVGRSYPVLEGYRNLDELREKIAPYTYRVLREDCADLPPKVYQKSYVEPTEPQKRAYAQLVEEFKAELHDGRTVTATMVLTRYLRLQQVLSNYWPSDVELAVHEPCDGTGCDGCDFLGVVEREVPPSLIDPKRNPRVERGVELIEEELTSHETARVIVWARFRNDLTEVGRALDEIGRKWVRYDGTTAAEERRDAMMMFKRGTARVFLSNPAAGGRGINLSEATMMIYLSNSYSLEQRLQSEDRAESLDKKHHTQVIDLVAPGTIDETITDALRSKRSLSREISGDPGRDWL